MRRGGVQELSIKDFKQRSGKNDDQQDCQPDKPFLRWHRIVENWIAFVEFPSVLFRFRDNREGQQNHREGKKGRRKSDIAFFGKNVDDDCNKSENDCGDSRGCRMTETQARRENRQLQQCRHQKETKAPVRDNGEKRQLKESGIHRLFSFFADVADLA